MPMTQARNNDLILGAAVGYRWAQIEPFVRSLRGTGCVADVVLLVSRPEPEVRRQLVAHGIRMVHVQRVVGRLPQHIARKRYNRRWLGWLHRRLPAWVAGSRPADGLRLALMTRVAGWFHHPACSRYFHYYRFLRRRAAHYDLVLTTDVRDVVFQADPFAQEWRPTQGQVVLEHAALLGQEPGNDLWIRIGFDDSGLQALRGQRVSCSGTTLAPAVQMQAYLAAMVRELGLRTHRFSGLDGVDQGVHNWLYWTGALAGFTAIPNFQGPILTLHGMPETEVPLDDHGQVIDHAGRIVPLLHQYDRHPELCQRVLQRWQPGVK